MDLGVLGQVKAFLLDQPMAAFLAVSLVANGILFRLLMKAHRDHLATVAQVVPLADRLVDMLQRAARRSAARTGTGAPQG